MNAAGDVLKDDEPFTPFLVGCFKKPKRKYRSFYPTGGYPKIYNEVMRLFGVPNPDRERYKLIDHTDNNSLHDNIKNLRWSNYPLNALNTGNLFKGFSIDRSCGRKMIYRAQIRWMGKTTSLDRFDNPKEARDCYYDCKAFIQKSFREHEFEDNRLVDVWRLKRKLVKTSDKEGINTLVSNLMLLTV